MMEKNKRNEIISNAINAAICIDDKYVSPYSSTKIDDPNYNDAKRLYQSFREQGKCALDIYKYSDLETFIKDKEYLLNHKELMILDWELNAEAPGKAKFMDALNVLEYAVSDKHIRCVTIYTQTEDAQLILLQIYSFFSRIYSIPSINAKIEELIENIADKIEELLQDIDDGQEYIEKLLKDSSSGFSFLPENEKNKILKDLKIAVINHIPTKDRKEFCTFIKDAIVNKQLEDEKFALSCYEIIQRKEIDDFKYTSKNLHSVEAYNNGKCLLVDNTIIFVLNKRETEVKNVYEKITESICEIPNHRTLLLSLMIRNIIYDNVGISGKGLGKVTDKMLIHHWQTYEHKDIDDLTAFLVLCMKEDLAVSLNNNIEGEDLQDLFESDEVIVADYKDLALFNKIITFVDKENLVNKKNHKLKTGDIFKLTSQLYKPATKDKESKANYDEYIICITQSCDCLRAEKINNNFAFAYGSTCVNMATALEEIESTDKYTIINDHTAIAWNNNFFTIHIDKNVFDVSNNLDVIIDNDSKQLEYVGNLKDFYAQRIINKIFNHALRIGVDLPHYKQEISKVRK